MALNGIERNDEGQKSEGVGLECHFGNCGFGRAWAKFGSRARPGLELVRSGPGAGTAGGVRDFGLGRGGIWVGLRHGLVGVWRGEVSIEGRG